MLNAVPPAAPRPIRPFDSGSMVPVSAWRRTAEVLSLALTTKVVPLLTSTIGGATIPGLGLVAPTGSVVNAPDVVLIRYRFPFALPTISIPRNESRTGEVRGKLLLTTTGQGYPLRVGVPCKTPVIL